MVQENEEAYEERDHRGDQNSSGCCVLGFSDAGTLLSCHFIGKKFDGGIECLGHPDKSDAEKDRHPFPAAQMQEIGDDKRRDCGQQMQLRIGLRAHHDSDSLQCVADALHSGLEISGDHRERW